MYPGTFSIWLFLHWDTFSADYQVDNNAIESKCDSKNLKEKTRNWTVFNTLTGNSLLDIDFPCNFYKMQIIKA